MKNLKYYQVRISFEKRIEAENEQAAKEALLDCMDNEPNHIEWEVELSSNYRVHAVRETLDKALDGGIMRYVERCDNSIADFFGVYEAQTGGTESWIADFRTYDDAVLFALEKEKEEIK